MWWKVDISSSACNLKEWLTIRFVLGICVVPINCEICFRLNDLQGEEKLLQRILVEQMICSDPMERPPAIAVRKHPIFWNKTQILTFFQV